MNEMNEMISELSRQVQECMAFYSNELSMRDLRISALEKDVAELKILLLNTPSTLVQQSEHTFDHKEKAYNKDVDDKALDSLSNLFHTNTSDIINNTTYPHSRLLKKLQKSFKKLQFYVEPGMSYVQRKSIFTKKTIGKEAIYTTGFWSSKEHLFVDHTKTSVVFKMTPIYYFEVTLRDISNPQTFSNLVVSMGVSETNLNLPSCKNHVGWIEGGVGMHSDDGKIFNMKGRGDDMAGRFNDGEVMGCGYLADKKMIFFTKNGYYLLAVSYERKKFRPTIVCDGMGEIEVNWGLRKFEFDFENIPEKIIEANL
ncbi:hypothetical protein EIN_280750 [Entamoeba invadens IP1]|uniref:B30.2/SPRY domain-containing protein n=1 Tax=Entamoeba invadens IP1 TaxID=370355 RepID=A0A0A1U7Y4_ENTIV|nr:hypothetical protein EIN_280750 [Entamoeba invadens IP1]ELP91008.1 hypothetical protein EIN_280750 [Entamoeba invadens IP1]|eukprot:XP_004257779.1 hypothetical protein EIN_280750 [Entamoeba invadens IP1]